MEAITLVCISHYKMPQKLTAQPHLPWKTRLVMSTFSFAIDICFRPNLTINRRLLSLLDFKSPPSNKSIDGVTTSDIIVDSSRNLWFRLYTPSTGGGDNFSIPVIFYFHGGGFALLAANSKLYNEFCKRLAKELNAIIVSVNYRLSPEHRFPCQYEDGVDVLKFIDSTNSESFPPCANLKHCFLAGDSAGANLAHHVAVRANEVEFGKLKLIGIIAIQPFFGGEERTESEIRLSKAPLLTVKLADWFWKAFLPEGSDRDHPAVNVFGPNSVDISRVNFPATIVFVGGFDILEDWGKRYYKGLKGCGKEAYLIEYPNAVHWFNAFPELPDSSLLIKEVREFIESQTAK